MAKPRVWIFIDMAFQKTKFFLPSAAVIFWKKQGWFWLPAILFGLESVAQGFYPFRSPFFWVVASKIPLAQVPTTLITLFRIFAWYLLLSVVLEGGRRLLVNQFPRLSRWFSPLVTHCIYLLAYLLCLRGLLTHFPGLGKHYVCSPYLFPLVLLLLMGSVIWWDRPGDYISRRWPLWLSGVISLTLLVRGANWSKPPSESLPFSPNPSKSSFLLLSFDAVPAALFAAEDSSGASSTPLLRRHWKNRALQFQQAHSVTNSTFTSWISLLSGRHPLRTEVDTLFPQPRLGNLRAQDLLPAKLSRLGYRTVFMTDCATTSYMEPAYGFQEIYQPEPGLRPCQAAAIVSVHPWTGILSRADGRNFFFPEANAFCSQMSRPDAFFSDVQKKLQSLQSADPPFLLAVHSCVTHRDVQEQLPEAGSPLRSGLPSADLPESSDKDRLLWSIRLADQFSHRLLGQAYLQPKPLWTFLFSDHGVRIDRQDGALHLFSHALGEPRNRYQYHVPLWIIPPTPQTRQVPHLVSLLDIYPTIAEIASLDRTGLEGMSLLGIDRSRRLIELSSASREPDSPQSEWARELARGHYEANGTFSFAPEQIQEIRRRRTLAIVEPPYRYLLHADGTESLYDEASDPFNEINLASDLKTTSRRLHQVLCSAYAPHCKSQRFTALGARFAGREPIDR